MKQLSKAQRSKYLSKCRDRLEAARGYRKHNELEDLWKRMADLYKGKHFPKNLSYDEAVAVNICFSTINVIAPSISVSRPRTQIRARKPEDYDKAVIAEAVVNYWWEEFELLPEFQLAIKDSLIFGIGWLKTGYRFVEREEIDVEGAAKKFQEARAQVDQYAMDNPDLAGNLPTDEELKAGIVATKRVIVHDAPFVERVSIHDVYVDPEATSLRNAKWIAQKLTKTIDEVRSNSSYKKNVRASVKPDSRVSDDWFRDDAFRSEPGGDRQRVTVWEYYDLQLGQMCVFSEMGDDFLVDPVSQPYSFGHPFLDIRNYEVPDQFYPMGELEALEPLQAELNMTRTAMFNDRKAFRRAWVYKQEAFDAQGRAQLQSDVDNRLIPVAGNMSLGEAIAPLPTNAPNPQLYQDSQVIEHDIQTVSGVNEYMRGAMGDIRRTATEASIVQDAANARAAEKLSRVEFMVGVISKRLLQLAQQFLSSEKVARVHGKNGAQMWVAYDRDDIALEADFSVEGGSTKPRNEAQRRQTAVQILQALAPFGDPKMGLVDMREVIRYALQYGFDVEDANRFIPDSIPAAVQNLGGVVSNESAPSDDPAMAQGQPMEGGQGAVPPDMGMMQGPPPDMGQGVPPEAMGAAPPDGGQGTIPPELLAMLMSQGAQ